MNGRRNQNYEYSGMSNANFSDSMPRRLAAPSFEGVPHGYPPQKPDYNGDSVYQQRYPPQYQQQRYQQGYEGYPTQGYQQYDDRKRPEKDIGNSYEMPMVKKGKNSGGYYDFSSNGSFTMKQ